MKNGREVKEQFLLLKLRMTLKPLLDPLLEQVYVQLFFLQHLL